MDENSQKHESNEREEVYRVTGRDLMDKIHEIIREGNARRIIIQNEKGETIIEFPVTVGAVGVLLAPMFAAVGAIAAVATKCTIIVEKRNPKQE